jgi:hypothetical protein
MQDNLVEDRKCPRFKVVLIIKYDPPSIDTSLIQETSKIRTQESVIGVLHISSAYDTQGRGRLMLVPYLPSWYSSRVSIKNCEMPR